MPFVEKSRFSHWLGTENWQYLPEKSANHENFFNLRLFDNSFDIVPEEFCPSRKLVTNF
jgi:hypothetical protein